MKKSISILSFICNILGSVLLTAAALSTGVPVFFAHIGLIAVVISLSILITINCD